MSCCPETSEVCCSLQSKRVLLVDDLVNKVTEILIIFFPLTHDGEGAHYAEGPEAHAEFSDESVDAELPLKWKAIRLHLVLLDQIFQTSGVNNNNIESPNTRRGTPRCSCPTGVSHPRLSTVREDMRFSRQPVSISTFTSCPKHCEQQIVICVAIIVS